LQPDDFAVAVVQKIAAMMNVMARIIAAGYITCHCRLESKKGTIRT